MSTAAYAIVCALVSFAVLGLADYLWRWTVDHWAVQTAQRADAERALTASVTQTQEDRARLEQHAGMLLKGKPT